MTATAPALSRLLLAGPGRQYPRAHEGFAGRLLEGDAVELGERPEDAARAVDPEGEDKGPSFCAVELGDWPAACGHAPDLPLLAWTFDEGGETMEIILAGLAAGGALGHGGVNLLLGPPLLAAAWRLDAAATAEVSGAFLEGLTAAGVAVCAGDLPAAAFTGDADAGQLFAGELRAYALAFTRGVDAVTLALEARDPERRRAEAAAACAALRDGLGFTGVVAARTVAEDAPGLLAAGCDLLVTADPGATERALLGALEDAELDERRILEAIDRVETWGGAWL